MSGQDNQPGPLAAARARRAQLMEDAETAQRWADIGVELAVQAGVRRVEIEGEEAVMLVVGTMLAGLAELIALAPMTSEYRDEVVVAIEDGMVKELVARTLALLADPQSVRGPVVAVIKGGKS